MQIFVFRTTKTNIYDTRKQQQQLSLHIYPRSKLVYFLSNNLVVCTYKKEEDNLQFISYNIIFLFCCNSFLFFLSRQMTFLFM
jgi:hypothetical protein